MTMRMRIPLTCLVDGWTGGAYIQNDLSATCGVEKQVGVSRCRQKQSQR
jgi:hypothetical protein